MQENSEKMILVADYGRSGQGWLSYMLCYILNAMYVEPYCLLRGLIYSGNDHIMNLTQGNLPGREKTPYIMVVKTHNLPDPYFSLTDKVILLARDPRDVTVSALARFRVVNRSGTDVEAGAQAQKMGKEMFETRSLARKFIDYIKTLKWVTLALTAARWRIFYESWAHIDFACKVKYEELSADPKKTLKRLLDYLEIEARESLVDEAVAHFAFQKITGRDKGSEQKENVAFRKGIVGDYKNNFSGLELSVFKKICGESMKQWGYE